MINDCVEWIGESVTMSESDWAVPVKHVAACTTVPQAYDSLYVCEGRSAETPTSDAVIKGQEIE